VTSARDLSRIEEASEPQLIPKCVGGGSDHPVVNQETNERQEKANNNEGSRKDNRKKSQCRQYRRTFTGGLSSEVMLWVTSKTHTLTPNIQHRKCQCGDGGGRQ